MNYNRISARCINEYTKARKQGLAVATITTRVQDVNSLALAIYARAPAVKVYYECLSNRIEIRGK